MRAVSSKIAKLRNFCFLRSPYLSKFHIWDQNYSDWVLYSPDGFSSASACKHLEWPWIAVLRYILFRVDSFSVVALALRHDCFKIDGDAHTHCQRQRCSPRSVVSGDIRLMPIFVGVRWWGGVKCEFSILIDIRNSHWLYISKFTRLRAVYWRQMALLVILGPPPPASYSRKVQPYSWIPSSGTWAAILQR